MLLYSGGVSCVRAVHSWSERWWATCHLSRDLSNYEKIEIENLLELSDLVEWKLCVTSWFLSQCVGSANLALSVASSSRSTAAGKTDVCRGVAKAAVPSSSAQRFVRDVPKSLEAHVGRCAQGVGAAGGAAGHVEALRQLLQVTCCPERCEVQVLGKSLDALRGKWLDPSVVQAKRCCLSDVLRGSIASCEGEHMCASMRDLALLCAYAISPGEGPLQQAPAQWNGLSRLLDQQLPLFCSLQASMTVEVPASGACLAVASVESANTLPLRAGDVWASAYCTRADGQWVSLRAPVASFRTFQYALRLLHCECWGALLEWCTFQDMAAFSSYVAAREWLASGHREAALLAFEQAADAADVLMECFPSDIVGRGSSIAAYFEHVAALLGARGLLSEECRFLSKAAHLAAETPEADSTLRQRLWTSLFEKLVSLDMLNEACEVLVHIESFEAYLRALAQKLRTHGRIDLIMGLPDRHRSRFIDNLHEHASLSPPTPGSDSLTCYQHLYALHFSTQEYYKAASIAHSLYMALEQSLQGVAWSSDKTCVNSFVHIGSGDCISRRSDVPQKKRATSLGALVQKQEDVESRMVVDGVLEVPSQAWPVLDQQRSALLMLSSALALTPDKVLLTPPPQHGAASRHEASIAARPSRQPESVRPSIDELAQQAFSFGSQQRNSSDVTLEPPSEPGLGIVLLKDAERCLALTEARLILCGGGGQGRPPPTDGEELAAGAAARRVAKLGLLALALKVATAHELDPWPYALQPFVRLCLEAERPGSDGQVAAVASAARGPTQVYMFVHGDASEPLGCSGGDAVQGWWQALEAGLNAAAGDNTSNPQSLGFLNASGGRLYSLVVDEVLASRPAAQPLPRFLVKRLANGPTWVILLRLYMKHRRLEDAVNLIGEQLKCCELTVTSFTPAKRLQWSPLQDFPVSLAVQLQRCIRRTADQDRDSRFLDLATELDRILAQFQSLLADSDRGVTR